ncbi:MAG: zinc finger Ran-binding domain-containing protein [Gemmatimonadaceae bacterium]
MTETTAGALAQVTELDEERRRFEGWLSQLEERRADTPAHVFDRVHGDYTTRLNDVLGRLAGHAEMLGGAVDDLARRIDELRADEQRCADERAEGELRAAVGEYTRDQWAVIEARTDATLADLVAERQQVEAEHGRLAQVLSLAAPAPAPTGTSSSEVGTPEATADPASHGVVVDDMAGATAANEASAPDSTSSAVEISVERVTPEHEDEVVAVETLAPDAPARASDPAAGSGSWTRGLGLTSAPGRGGLGAPPPQPSESDRMLDDLRSSVSQSPLAADSGTPQIKTLKCQECGTMNYPTEWYCERCGGELAAL